MILRSVLFAALMFGPSYAIASPSDMSDWHIVGSNNPAESARSPAVAFLRSDEGGAMWLSCGKLPSGEPVLRVAVSAQAVLGRGVKPRRLTLVKFDDKPPEHVAWVYGEHAGGPADHEASARFLANLSRADALQLQLVNYRLEETPLKFSFDPDRTKSVMNKIDSDCRSFSINRAE